MENANNNSKFQSNIYKLRIYKLNEAIDEEIRKGNELLSKDDKEFTAIILQKASKFLFIDFILSLLTLSVWAIVWLIKSESSQVDKKYKISVDKNGKVKKVDFIDNDENYDDDDYIFYSSVRYPARRNSGMPLAVTAVATGII